MLREERNAVTMTTRQRLARIAEAEARRPFHGFVMSLQHNLQPIVSLFPPWPIHKWVRNWCAAFVYYCCLKAGFELPVRWPDDRVPTNFALCAAWLAWAKLPALRLHSPATRGAFQPQAADTVIYDHVFNGSPHDHIGIVLEVRADTITVAEGNVNNASAVITRPKDRHIRGYIRIPSGFALR